MDNIFQSGFKDYKNLLMRRAKENDGLYPVYGTDLNSAVSELNDFYGSGGFNDADAKMKFNYGEQYLDQINTETGNNLWESYDFLDGSIPYENDNVNMDLPVCDKPRTRSIANDQIGSGCRLMDCDCDCEMSLNNGSEAKISEIMGEIEDIKGGLTPVLGGQKKKKGKKGRKGGNPDWIKFVKKVQQEKGISYKDALKEASKIKRKM